MFTLILAQAQTAQPGLVDRLVETIVGALRGVDPLLIVFIISLLPILELRGGLIAASFMGVDMWQALPVSIIGTLIPVPFILFFITKIFDWMKTTKPFRPIAEKLENRAMSKKDQIERWEFWGLVLFVGIPLPGTGAWTGSLIAALLGIRFRKAFPAVIIGALIAAAIISLIFYGALGAIIG